MTTGLKTYWLGPTLTRSGVLVTIPRSTYGVGDALVVVVRERACGRDQAVASKPPEACWHGVPG
jgi:hypothetical protein